MQLKCLKLVLTTLSSTVSLPYHTYCAGLVLYSSELLRPAHHYLNVHVHCKFVFQEEMGCPKRMTVKKKKKKKKTLNVGRDRSAQTLGPYQMQYNADSDQGLHCLPLTKHYFRLTHTTMEED